MAPRGVKSGKEMTSATNEAKSWPFEQARALLAKVGDKQEVVFETGFGPSGAPHVGTFGEVVRTNMVRRAFNEITEGRIKTRLIVFSDDYDGFRRVPTGMPESMEEDLGKPLTAVRDPLGEYESFAERNNAALNNFLYDMGFEDGLHYDFLSATECYKSGLFNQALISVLNNYDAVRGIMLPNLGEARRETYSPFMPISPVTGNVLAEGVLDVDPFEQTVRFIAEDGKEYECPVINGNVKLQWKADWGMRWAALGVDYEMHGKDLLDSAKLSSRINKAIGATPPLNYFYELFLDDDGSKLSKSKGSGLSVEEWMHYSTHGPLAYFMFQSPRSAKPFSASIIPRITDEYLKALTAYSKLDKAAQYDSPIWHVHGGSQVSYDADVSYSLLLNLASVSDAKDSETLFNYLRQYKGFGEDRELIGSLIPGAIAYVQEKTERKVKRAPTELEKSAFAALADKLETMDDGLDGEAYQFEVYEIGKSFGFDPLRSWFQAIYEVLFGDSQGPRFGSFIAAYGRARSIELLRSAT